MSFISAPSSGGTTAWLPLDPDIYEAFIAKVEEVENPFYNPQTDKPSKAKQFKWTLALREDVIPEVDEDLKAEVLAKDKDKTEVSYSTRPTYFTGQTLGKHPKNKFMNLLKATKVDFEAGFDTEEAFKSAVVGKAIRIVTSVNDNGYTKVETLMPSKRADASLDEIIAVTMGGAEISETDGNDF